MILTASSDSFDSLRHSESCCLRLPGRSDELESEGFLELTIGFDGDIEGEKKKQEKKGESA